jgi:hypothetical protein
MRPTAGRRARPVLLAAAAVLALSACGTGPAPAPVAAAAGGFDAAAAGAVLTRFDTLDSTASTAADPKALAGQETSPSLDFSLASARTAQANGRRQPPFTHVRPSFAIPAGAEPLCFLATGVLQLSGQELAQPDVSQFVRTAAGWKLSHNVQVSAGAGTDAGIAFSSAGPTAAALPIDRRQALSAELFARSIAATGSTPTLIAPSPVLDQRLAAGWTFYQQQLAAHRTTATRRLVRAEWSDCAARTAAGTLAFVTVYAVDTLAPAHGGPAAVTLPAGSPDLLSTGHRQAVRGTSISVERTEIFLLSVPDSTAAQSTVLGLNDAATAVTATG